MPLDLTQANMRAPNGIYLACPLLLPVGTVNSVPTLKDTTKSDIWTLPTADMFIKIKVFGAGAFCICVTPYENGNHSAKATGPLVFDFAKDAVLIGREVIGLEGLGLQVRCSSLSSNQISEGGELFCMDAANILHVRVV